MNSLQSKFAGKIDFLGVYISEAHAQDEWPLGVKYCFNQPKTIEDRLEIARNFVSEFKFELPMLVDTMANEFDTRFAAWPERFYIVQNNELVLVGEPTTEFGFDRTQLEHAFNELLQRQQPTQ
jgi:type I thyroxine 5'-deiodinase